MKTSKVEGGTHIWMSSIWVLLGCYSLKICWELSILWTCNRWNGGHKCSNCGSSCVGFLIQPLALEGDPSVAFVGKQDWRVKGQTLLEISERRPANLMTWKRSLYHQFHLHLFSLPSLLTLEHYLCCTTSAGAVAIETDTADSAECPNRKQGPISSGWEILLVWSVHLGF